MDIAIVLGFVFLLCLLLLVMIFGDQLSILGAFHGRWIRSLAESFADLCDFLWDEIDRAFEFVVEHVWWVLAVGSGGSGGLIVAWMMFGGVADQATADLAGRVGRLDAGGILDQVPEIASLTEVEKTSLIRDQDPIARRTWQVPSPHSWTPERGIARDDDDWDSPGDGFLPPWPRPGRDLDAPEFEDFTQPASDRRELVTLLPEDRLRTQRVYQPYTQWQVELGEDELEEGRFTEVPGKTVVSGSLRREIDYALNQLEFQRTRWRLYDRFDSGRRERDEFRSVVPGVREVTLDELDELEARLRVVSGGSIAESDLDIEKQLRPGSSSGEFDVEIRVTNRSRRRMSGLLVRERLPYGVQPLSVDDDGVFRDATITWVIDELMPRATQVVQATLVSESAESFVARTEVSAIAAVASEVFVEPNRRDERPPRGSEPPRRRTEPPVRRNERPARPPVSRRPDVRMSVGEIPSAVDVREKLEIPFRLSNVGNGVAGEITLRIELPLGLDHFHLEETDRDRSVVVNLRDLEPGQSRTVMLRVRATDPGDQEAFVQLLVDRREADLRTFNVKVRESESEDLPPLEPEPDFGLPSRPR